MAGDEVGRINVIEGEADTRVGVYTPCTNDVNKNTDGICWVPLSSKLHAVLQFVQGSGGQSLTVGVSITIHCLALCMDVPCLQDTSQAVVGMTCHNFVPIDGMHLIHSIADEMQHYWPTGGTFTNEHLARPWSLLFQPQ